MAFVFVAVAIVFASRAMTATPSVGICNLEAGRPLVREAKAQPLFKCDDSRIDVRCAAGQRRIASAADRKTDPTPLR